MKWNICVLLVFAAEIAVAMRNQIFEEDFSSFIKTYNKTYASADKRDAALANFAHESLACMEQELRYMRNESTFRMQVNMRSDETPEQKVTWRGLRDDALTNLDFEPRSEARDLPAAPDSLDYRELGLVTDVGDQGFYCGACFAFGSLCALEGQLAKKNGTLPPWLSVQSIIDCSREYGNYGCNGGYLDRTYRFLVDLRGVQDYDSYPYEEAEGQCRYYEKNSVGSVKGFKRVVGDEENLKRTLVDVGPLAVAIKADTLSFYNYYEGVLDDNECRGKPNHIVCLVGYGTDTSYDPPVDYWIIKNSWSPYWGEGGYIRIKRGSNLCSVSNYVFYPEV